MSVCLRSLTRSGHDKQAQLDGVSALKNRVSRSGYRPRFRAMLIRKQEAGMAALGNATWSMTT
jgi:hypothetical protein